MSNFISLNELLRPNGIAFPQVGNNILFSRDALKHEEITFNVNGLPQITKSEITIEGPEEKTVTEESIHELLEKQIKTILIKGDTGELSLIPELIYSLNAISRPFQPFNLDGEKITSAVHESMHKAYSHWMDKETGDGEE